MTNLESARALVDDCCRGLVFYVGGLPPEVRHGSLWRDFIAASKAERACADAELARLTSELEACRRFSVTCHRNNSELGHRVDEANSELARLKEKIAGMRCLLEDVARQPIHCQGNGPGPARCQSVVIDNLGPLMKAIRSTLTGPETQEAHDEAR